MMGTKKIVPCGYDRLYHTSGIVSITSFVYFYNTRLHMRKCRPCDTDGISKVCRIVEGTAKLFLLLCLQEVTDFCQQLFFLGGLRRSRLLLLLAAEHVDGFDHNEYADGSQQEIDDGL